MPSTRTITLDKLQSMLNKLKLLEQQAIEIGMLYENSDAILSGVMYATSKMVEVVIPLIEKAIEEL